MKLVLEILHHNIQPSSTHEIISNLPKELRDQISFKTYDSYVRPIINNPEALFAYAQNKKNKNYNAIVICCALTICHLNSEEIFLDEENRKKEEKMLNTLKEIYIANALSMTEAPAVYSFVNTKLEKNKSRVEERVRLFNPDTVLSQFHRNIPNETKHPVDTSTSYQNETSIKEIIPASSFQLRSNFNIGFSGMSTTGFVAMGIIGILNIWNPIAWAILGGVFLISTIALGIKNRDIGWKKLFPLMCPILNVIHVSRGKQVNIERHFSIPSTSTSFGPQTIQPVPPSTSSTTRIKRNVGQNSKAIIANFLEGEKKISDCETAIKSQIKFSATHRGVEANEAYASGNIEKAINEIRIFISEMEQNTMTLEHAKAYNNALFLSLNLLKLDILKDIRINISEENRQDVYTAIFEADQIDLTSPVLQNLSEVLRNKIQVLMKSTERFNSRTKFIENVERDYEMPHDERRESLTF